MTITTMLDKPTIITSDMVAIATTSATSFSAAKHWLRTAMPAAPRQT